MNNRPLCTVLRDGEELESGVLKRSLSYYWIEKLIAESDGIKVGRLAAIGLAKKCYCIKEHIDSGDLVFVPYKTVRLYVNNDQYTEREIESISIEYDKFIIKFKKS